MIRDHLSPRSRARTGSWFILLVCLWMVVGCQIKREPTQAEVEQVLANYPSAQGLTRTVGTADNSDIGITYTYMTMDSEASILAYYDQKLTQLGLDPSPGEAQARKINALYRISGCPGYGVRIRIDSVSKTVNTLLVVTPFCR